MRDIASARTVLSGPRFAPYIGGPPLVLDANPDPIFAVVDKLAREVGGPLAEHINWRATAAGLEVLATLGEDNFANRHILLAVTCYDAARQRAEWTGEILFGVRDVRQTLGGFYEATVVAKIALRVEAPFAPPRRLATDPFLATGAVEVGRIVYKLAPV